MPIDSVLTEDQFSGDPVENAWAYCQSSIFLWDSKNCRFVYDLYVNRGVAFDGKSVLKTLEMVLPAEGIPALTRTIEVSPGSPAVIDPETGVETSPAVPPTYRTDELRPRIPGLPEILATRPEVYAAYQTLTAVVDELAKVYFAEFSEGAIEPA